MGGSAGLRQSLPSPLDSGRRPVMSKKVIFLFRKERTSNNFLGCILAIPKVRPHFLYRSLPLSNQQFMNVPNPHTFYSLRVRAILRKFQVKFQIFREHGDLGERDGGGAVPVLPPSLLLCPNIISNCGIGAIVSKLNENFWRPPSFPILFGHFQSAEHTRSSLQVLMARKKKKRKNHPAQETTARRGKCIITLVVREKKN